jgi:type II restriction enzyme
MTYYDRIKELTKAVPPTLVDFDVPRDPSRTPTQATSNFITNKEQGDWAEGLITRAINETSKNYVAVKYGKSDDLVAGEDGLMIFIKNSREN